MNPASTLSGTLLALYLNVPALGGVQLFTESNPWVPPLSPSPSVSVESLATRFAGASKRAANRPPSAYAGKERLAMVGEVVEFYGQGASPDQSIIEYSWDFESDGVVDFVSPVTGDTRHAFTVPGDYRCLLKVRDSRGQVVGSVRRVLVISTNADLKVAESALHPAVRYKVNAADGFRHRYAILFNGGSEQRFWEDMTLCYAMLTNRAGFPPADIYLLNYDGTINGENPGGMIDGAATFDGLQTVISNLAMVADADDEVFFCITDHGRGYSGPLSQGGLYIGYLDGRASVDPGDEPDYAESNFKLRSLMTGGEYTCNHGLNEWKVFKSADGGRTAFYRHKYVSHFDNLYIESRGTPVSNHDVFIERLVDYARGDFNKDGYLDTSIGEVFDYDGDGVPPYDPATGLFDEDDWGEIDEVQDFNNLNTQLPEGASPYKLFDNNFEGKLCVDLGYKGGPLQVDARDEDGLGLLDWMDVNQDGDTNDTISIDEALFCYNGPIYDDDLRAFLNQLSVAKITIIAEPCFSGGLVEDLSAPNRVICAATIEEAVSYGNTFIRGFIAALHGWNEYGEPVDADTDGNGAVSMLEAFNYAESHDYYDETPQYDDNGDGVSHPGPMPMGGDGALGANTYLFGDIVVPTGPNEWTKSTSGYWEEPYWSWGQLPARGQGLIALRNPGWKALAIGPETVANYSNSLAVDSLTIQAPADSFNLLLLNYAGLNVPLSIASDFSLGPNTSLVSYYSCLNAETLLLSGPASFSSQSVASLGSIVVGDSAPGELNIADASIRAGDITVGRDASGTVNQSGGTNQVQALYLPGSGAHAQGSANYALTGGTLLSGLVMLGGEPFGSFVQSGGVHSNAGNITLHGQMLEEPWGIYRLMGGLLLSPRLQVEGGQFIQGSATNQTGVLMLDLMASFNLCQGTLVSSNTSIRSNGARNRGQLSSFLQSNGSHTVQNTLLLDGIYRLEAGTLVASNIHIWIDGQLQLEGGNVENSGSFSLDNGTCLARGQNYNLGKLLIRSTSALSRFPDGPLTCTFDLQSGSTVLHFLDSHDLASDWSGSLHIANWSGSANGGGTDQVFVGTTAQGLTPAQLSRIVFVNPDGLPVASYPARILATGEIVPGPRPTVNMAGSPGGLVLSWTGNYRLFRAPNVTGPYTAVFDASSPYTNPFSGPQGFFQLRSP